MDGETNRLRQGVIISSPGGWPTPLGVAANTTLPLFNDAGECVEPGLKSNLAIMATQVMRLATSNCLAE